jgi:ABC-2 type transport system permease protein
LATPVQSDGVLRGIISALSYAGVCSALAWWRFLRKDVLS